jgi:hypothetical protein
VNLLVKKTTTAGWVRPLQLFCFFFFFHLTQLKGSSPLPFFVFFISYFLVFVFFRVCYVTSNRRHCRDIRGIKKVRDGNNLKQCGLCKKWTQTIGNQLIRSRLEEVMASDGGGSTVAAAAAAAAAALNT